MPEYTLLSMLPYRQSFPSFQKPLSTFMSATSVILTVCMPFELGSTGFISKYR